jgi:hypothetical protein
MKYQLRPAVEAGADRILWPQIAGWVIKLGFWAAMGTNDSLTRPMFREFDPAGTVATEALDVIGLDHTKL